MALGTAYGQEKTAIAVLPLEGRNISADEAMTLSDRLRAELTNAGTYSIMERAEMEKVLNGQEKPAAAARAMQEAAVKQIRLMKE